MLLSSVPQQGSQQFLITSRLHAEQGCGAKLSANSNSCVWCSQQPQHMSSQPCPPGILFTLSGINMRKKEACGRSSIQHSRKSSCIPSLLFSYPVNLILVIFHLDYPPKNIQNLQGEMRFGLSFFGMCVGFQVPFLEKCINVTPTLF